MGLSPLHTAMHIYEGILAATTEGRQVLAAGALLTAGGTTLGLWQLDYQRIPRVAVLSAAFFVISTIHVPIGPTSEHLLLTGLMGLVLGWAAFPAILVALVLQAVMFSFGGPATLGVNTLIMAAPAVACYYLFRRPVRSPNEAFVFAVGAAAGATAILLGGLLGAATLSAAGSQFQLFGLAMFLGHLPLAVVEGMMTGSVAVLLRKVRPELLDAELLQPMPAEAPCD